MRNSNYAEYSSSVNTVTCIKPDPLRAVFLAQMATIPPPTPGVTLSDAFGLI